MNQSKPWPIRFWAKVQKTNNPTECWNWVGHIQFGCPRFRNKNRVLKAQCWLFWDIDSSNKPFDVALTCGNRLCCNPAHMIRGRELAPVRKKRTLHGLSKTPTYSIWDGIRQRCYNPRAKYYHIYGGRGISMCERWANDYAAFLSDMGERPLGKSIDRINNDGNYEPGNCRWATPAEQNRNLSRNDWLTYNGERKILADWAYSRGMDRGTLRSRLRGGWSMDRALSVPVQQRPTRRAA